MKLLIVNLHMIGDENKCFEVHFMEHREKNIQEN